MILRRVIEHVKHQNWTAVVLDFLIVVVGVFIGIQVANWNEARSDHQRERQIVSDMLADLEIDRTQYTNAMAYGERRLAAANASLTGAGLAPIEFDYDLPFADIVSYSFDIAEAGESAGASETLWTDLVIGYFPTPSTSTYDAMVGAGEIKIIRDRRLVRTIQIYRNLLGSVDLQNEKLSTIRTNTLSIGAASGLAPYTKLQIDDYFRLVATDAELAATIRILATFTIFHYGEIKSADRHAAMLQEQLNSYLERRQ
ncbi:hypothetical protein ACFOOP_16455 [Marinicaulis aureus]|uniref:Uncharacterized protein n=1 Tax=Hyphococcus aureus TaxID=2666033 RepID=A0ABW1L2D7_9PROT